MKSLSIRSFWYKSLVLCLVCLFVLCTNFAPVYSQSTTTLLISPDSSTLDTCEEIEIAVRVENVTDLTAYHLEITYDPNVIQVISVRNGDFLTEGLYEPTNAIDSSQGLITFGMAQLNSEDNPLEAKSGSGDLIYIKIRAKQADSTVEFAISSNSILVNWPDAQAIPYDAYTGTVMTENYTNVVQDWYLAEGYTGDNMQTFILVQNPGDDTAQICVAYMLQGGGLIYKKIEVPAQSRYTIATQEDDQVGTGVAFSTKLSSSQNIIVERSMYWPNGEGTQGGHASTGVTSPALQWYLAEGYTGNNFQTYILIQNPTETDATVQVTYMPDSGSNVVKTLTVPGNSRYTIITGEGDADGPGFGTDKAFATRVASTNGVPIVVERAMYFANEGTEAMGVTNPSNYWFLAEGYTDLGFRTYILIQNPNSVSTDVTLTYMLSDSSTVTRQITVSPNSRFTVVGAESATYGVGNGKTFSTAIHATQPIIVERAMYWTNGDNTLAGHDSPGVTGSAFAWNLAEGFTGAGFDTRILVQNPNDAWANITITYMKQGGGIVTKTVSIQPHARFTIIGSEDDLFGIGADLAFSTHIESDQPIIVERAMYFPGGGHGTTGVPE
ncbi:MAG: cohesin domain-containing protein [Anaerolineaceae bacterium]|nr:cohesin domain-containing protein [Anaerolineaceae bacterium]